MNAPGTFMIAPSAGVANMTAYQPPQPATPVDLRLDSNEGVAPPRELLDMAAKLDAETLRRYPSTRALEGLLARRLGVEPRQVIVTGGADDALDRACRAVLGPGRELILPVPTFEMLERYPLLVGAAVVPVPWPGGRYPTADVIRAAGPQTGAIAVVTPNNPTGAVASAQDLHKLSAAASHILLIVDLAYVEFADEDLTPVALALPNAIAVRTLSKAWGLAGLRVGYAVGPARVIDWLRAAGGPYPTSTLSLTLAAQRLETGEQHVRQFVQRVRNERAALSDLLRARGVSAVPSQANFLLARFGDAGRVRDGLAAIGIAVRGFPGRPELKDSLRITLPGEPAAFARLTAALDAIHAADPEAFRTRSRNGEQP